MVILNLGIYYIHFYFFLFFLNIRRLYFSFRTPEEENYSNRLVRDFLAGHLQDCADGTTLRAYLATKLCCSPMRISKKYAGQCIGKVFKRKLALLN